MRLSFKKSEIIPFLGFFLITVGNGKFIQENYGYKIEYLGLILLLCMCYFSLTKWSVKIKKIILVLIFTFILTIGPFVQGTSISGCLMICSTSFILMSFALISDNIIPNNRRIKVIADAIFCGAITTILIGIVTGSLGLYWGISNSIIGISFLAGFQIKNYCGGIWLISFIFYYIYYLREKKINRYVLFILSILIILSGSRGSFVLLLITILFINFDKFLKMKKSQKRIAVGVAIIILIVFGLYVYTHILANVATYAYRMRGLQNLWDILISDSSRLIFGISDIAYADTGLSYTLNMRTYLGWESSVEMAYVNILIKNGIIGFIPYAFVFARFYKKANYNLARDRSLIISVMLITIISGFVETYFVSIHYVVGPSLYILLNGIVSQNIKSKK